MISNRPQFLSALFAEFDAGEIAYCISRNAGETFANTGSDVDLVVSPSDLKSTERVCRDIAAANGYRLAMRTRFTNLCLLFWSPNADFVRIDIEPGVRWKLFPVVTASELLADRKHEGSLFVPSALGEALVLSAKVAWMGKLSERYGKRLEVLSEETGDFLHADEGARKIIGFAQDSDSDGLRRWLVMRTLARPSRWPGLAAALMDDFKRVLSRILRPPGVHVCFHGTQALDWDVLSRHLQMGFPVQKASVFDHKPALKRAFCSLFRGGLVLEQKLARESVSAPRPGGPAWRMAAAGNRISIFRPGNGKLYLAHEASGLMAEHEDLPGRIAGGGLHRRGDGPKAPPGTGDKTRPIHRAGGTRRSRENHLRAQLVRTPCRRRIGWHRQILPLDPVAPPAFFSLAVIRGDTSQIPGPWPSPCGALRDPPHQESHPRALRLSPRYPPLGQTW